MKYTAQSPIEMQLRASENGDRTSIDFVIVHPLLKIRINKPTNKQMAAIQQSGSEHTRGFFFIEVFNCLTNLPLSPAARSSSWTPDSKWVLHRNRPKRWALVSKLKKAVQTQNAWIFALKAAYNLKLGWGALHEEGWLERCLPKSRTYAGHELRRAHVHILETTSLKDCQKFTFRFRL